MIKIVLERSTVLSITLRENCSFDLVFTEDNSQLAASTFQANLTSQGFVIHFPRGTGAFILLDLE